MAQTGNGHGNGEDVGQPPRIIPSTGAATKPTGMPEALRNLANRYGNRPMTAGFGTELGPSGNAAQLDSYAPRYPARYYKKTPEEDELETQRQAVRAFAGPDAAGDTTWLRPQLPMETATNLIKKKQEQAYQAQIALFIEKNYDMKNPVNVKYVMDTYPEYFEEKHRVIDDMADLLKKIAHLNLMCGYIAPGDEETKAFALAINFGIINVDQDVMKYFLPTRGQFGPNADVIQKGLFNPSSGVKEVSMGNMTGGIANLLHRGDGANLEVATHTSNLAYRDNTPNLFKRALNG